MIHGQDNDFLDYTNRAWDVFSEVADDVDFLNADSELIYQALQSRIPVLHFGDYLRRYITRKLNLDQNQELSLKEYQEIIRDSFADRDTPCSFTPTTAKMSALSKNWLTLSIHDDSSLLFYLAKLKAKNNRPQISVTSLDVYTRLCNKAKGLVAHMYSQDPVHRDRKIHSINDITLGDLESVLSSAIPKDRNGNLLSVKRSALYRQLSEKRFGRQRAGSILNGSASANRFDIITLNFFIFSQLAEDQMPLTDSFIRNRFFRFINSTNELLNLCSMGELYIQNPYECFILMCMASQDPHGTYADVWEMSYN